MPKFKCGASLSYSHRKCVSQNSSDMIAALTLEIGIWICLGPRRARRKNTIADSLSSSHSAVFNLRRVTTGSGCE